MRGNLAQANPILRQVEQLIYEADQLDREASVHLSQIEKNNDEVQILMTHAMANVCFGGELMQSMADLQTQLTDLQSQLQEKKGESTRGTTDRARDKFRYGSRINPSFFFLLWGSVLPLISRG